MSPFAVNEPEALSELLTTHLSLLVTGIPEEASGPQNRGRREMGGRPLRRDAQGSDSSVTPAPAGGVGRLGRGEFSLAAVAKSFRLQRSDSKPPALGPQGSSAPNENGPAGGCTGGAGPGVSGGRAPVGGADSRLLRQGAGDPPAAALRHTEDHGGVCGALQGACLWESTRGAPCSRRVAQASCVVWHARPLARAGSRPHVPLAGASRAGVCGHPTRVLSRSLPAPRAASPSLPTRGRRAGGSLRPGGPSGGSDSEGLFSQ